VRDLRLNRRVDRILCNCANLTYFCASTSSQEDLVGQSRFAGVSSPRLPGAFRGGDHRCAYAVTLWADRGRHGHNSPPSGPLSGPWPPIWARFDLSMGAYAARGYQVTEPGALGGGWSAAQDAPGRAGQEREDPDDLGLSQGPCLQENTRPIPGDGQIGASVHHINVNTKENKVLTREWHANCGGVTCALRPEGPPRTRHEEGDTANG